MFEDLLGRLVDKFVGLEVGSERVELHMHDGARYAMYHQQDCCENVNLAEIVGDMPDMTKPCWIVRAEESSEKAATSEDIESGTWTFYRMDTSAGCFVMRWLGRSNGYYSERVEFEKLV